MTLQVGIPLFELNSKYDNINNELINELYTNSNIFKEFNIDVYHIQEQIKGIYQQTNIIPNIYITNKIYKSNQYTDTYWRNKYYDLHQEIYNKHQDIIKTLN